MAERRAYTPWHPLFVAMARYVYRERYVVHGEFQLSSWPLRADVVLIEREEGAGPLRRVPALSARLGRRYTLVELKGPTDELERDDVPVLVSYAALLEVKEQIARPSDIHTIVVASVLSEPFRRRLEEAGGHLVQQDRGQYLVDGMMYPTYCIEAGPASETAGNGLLYAFSREQLERPGRLRERMSGAERDLYGELCQHIQQLKQSKEAMAMKDAELFGRTADEILRDVVAAMPPEERLRGLPAEERLRGLPAEERLRGLLAEERLRGLPAEERLAGLSQEELEHLTAFLLKKIRH